DPGDRDVLGREAPHGQRRRRVEPEELVNRALQRTGIVAYRPQLLRVAQQQRQPVADEVDRVLEAGADEQEREREQLVLGEPAALVARVHQRGEQVVATTAALGLDELG